MYKVEEGRKMEITELRNYLEFKDTIIEWMNNEFGNEDSYHFYENIVNHSLIENKLPITFVAVEDGKLLGTVGVWRGDLLSRQDLFPWLSALIVNSEYRNAGVGKKLQDYVLQYAKNKGYDEIFLYTDLKNYYEKNNWEKYDIGYEYTGTEISIYKCNLK